MRLLTALFGLASILTKSSSLSVDVKPTTDIFFGANQDWELLQAELGPLAARELTDKLCALNLERKIVYHPGIIFIPKECIKNILDFRDNIGSLSESGRVYEICEIGEAVAINLGTFARNDLFSAKYSNIVAQARMKGIPPVEFSYTMRKNAAAPDQNSLASNDNSSVPICKFKW